MRIAALDIEHYRRKNSELLETARAKQKKFIDSLTLAQYKAYNKALNKLRLEFRQDHNDLLGLRYDSLDITKITKNKTNIAYFNAMVIAYYNWLHYDNRCELYLVA